MRPRPAAGQATAEELCRAVVLWLHTTVGLVLPVLAAAWLSKSTTESWRGAEADPDDSEQLSTFEQRLPKRLRRLTAAANQLLGRLLGAGSGWCTRAAIAWYVLSNSWLLCVLSAYPGPSDEYYY